MGEGTRGGGRLAGWPEWSLHAAAAAPAAAPSPPFTHRARPSGAAPGQGLTIGREHGGNQVRIGEGLDDGGVGGLHSTGRSRAKCRKVRKASASSRMCPEGGGGVPGAPPQMPRRCRQSRGGSISRGLPRRRAAQGRYSQPHRFADDVQALPCPTHQQRLQQDAEVLFLHHCGKERASGAGSGTAGGRARRGQRGASGARLRRASLSPALRFAGSAGARGLPHTQRIIFEANAA